MSFFGITDPFVIAAYIGCFLTTITSCLYGYFRKNKEYTDEESDE